MPSSKPLKIGILGSGNMGRALGIRFAQVGHSVFFSGRATSTAPQRAAQVALSHSPKGASIKHGTLDEAAQWSDVLIWTVRERSPSAVFSSKEAIHALAGKLIVDLNNRGYADEVVGGPEEKGARWFEESLGEQLQTNLKEAGVEAHVLKAFNTVAMEALDVSAEKLKEAGAQVWVAAMGPSNVRHLGLELVQELGFEAVDLGDGKTAMRIAEALGDAVRWVMIQTGKGGMTNLGIRMLPSPDLGIVGAREDSKYS